MIAPSENRIGFYVVLELKPEDLTDVSVYSTVCHTPNKSQEEHKQAEFISEEEE